MQSKIKSLHIFYHRNNRPASIWNKKILLFLKNKFPQVKLDEKKPEVLVVLGGDGTILEGVRKYKKAGSMILGLNMGQVGFLASVREENKFLVALSTFLKGKFKITERMMLKAEVQRKGKIVFSSEALNEVVVKNPLGMADIRADIEDHQVQHVRGTGIMVTTATGSTAYNLSAHGPVIMPDIKCLVITELLDHNIPTPSVVAKYNNRIFLRVLGFKKRGLLSISKNKQKFDVLLISDGEKIFPLEKNDTIVVESSPELIKFVELEKHYFFKSLQEKFGFK